MSVSRAFPAKLRRAVYERDSYRCRKCGMHSPNGKSLEPHHVIPVVDGGSDELDNLHTLCGMCHGELSWLWLNRPPAPYEKWLKLRPAAVVMRFLLQANESDMLGLDPETVRLLLFTDPT